MTFLWNESVPADVKDCFANLPSKSSPKAPAKPTKRLLNLAAEIAIDELRPTPTREAYDKLFAVLDGQLAQHKADVDKNLAAILTAEIRRITANRLDGESSETSLQLASDERTIDDAFKTATRAFGVAVANGYAKRLAINEADGDDDALDIYAAKARVAALATLPVVVGQVEAAAEQIITEWFSALHAAIKTLPDERRSAYDEIQQQAKEPQLVDVVVPVSRIEMTFELDGDKKTPLATRERHVLADEEGHYPIGKLLGWEVKVLDTELGRNSTVAWYRNPSSPTKDSVQIPWHGERWRSMQPDFVFFAQKGDGEIAPVIVDPHGHHLSDALDKLKALANFAEDFAEHFMRIAAVSSNEKGDLGTARRAGSSCSTCWTRKFARACGSRRARPPPTAKRASCTSSVPVQIACREVLRAGKLEGAPPSCRVSGWLSGYEPDTHRPGCCPLAVEVWLCSWPEEGGPRLSASLRPGDPLPRPTHPRCLWRGQVQSVGRERAGSS